MNSKTRKKISGLLIAALGLALLLKEFGYFDVDLLKFWPLIVFAYGLKMLLD